MDAGPRPRYALDHVLIAVRDLAGSARVYSEELGFSLSPEGVHPGRGTHNRLIVFGSEYLELIAYRDRSEGEFRPTMTTFLERREGLYMFALGTDDIDRAASELRGRGVDAAEPVDGAREAREGAAGYSWRSAALPREATPGSETFLIQHNHSMEERYGQPPGLFKHRNCAAGVHSLEIVVADAEAAAARWREALDLDQPGPPEEAPDIGGRKVRLRLRNCHLDFVSPTGPGPVGAFLERNGEAPFRLTLRSSDLDAVSALLERPLSEGADVSLSPERASGVSLRFV